MAEKVRQTPLSIAIEVLSSDDRIPRVLTRLSDFWRMGMRNIWILGPEERTAMIYVDGVCVPLKVTA